MSARILRQLTLTSIVVTGLAFVTPVFAATDSWITSKVKVQLLTSENVSGSDINVDTKDGVVVLHGKVKSAMEKEKAESLARGTEGVVSVNNLLQVAADTDKEHKEDKTTTASDEHIKSAVEKHLKQDKTLSDIHVASVNNGVVTLAGRAETIDQELRAVQMVRQTAGVKRVATDVTTMDANAQASNDAEEHKPNLGEKASGSARNVGKKITGATNKATAGTSDATITSQVKLRFMGDSRVPATDINVDTNHGVVTLFGIVPSHQSKQAAETGARNVSGVKSVKNALQVVPDSEKKVVAAKDDDIEKNVSGAFKNMKDFEKVDVDAKNGVVRLTGKVATLNDKVRAATIARSQTGVRAVEDELKVEK